MNHLFNLGKITEGGHLISWDLLAIHLRQDIILIVCFLFVMSQDNENRIVTVGDPKPFKSLRDLSRS